MITLEELNADFSSVAIKDGANQLAIDVDGKITAVVEATNLDIRDLAFATDKVDVSGSTIALDATTLAALENVVVSATDLDIRDLAFATDKVDVSGSTILTQQDAYDIWKATSHSASSTVSQIAATPLTGRMSIIIENVGNDPVFIGQSNAVTVSSGIKVAAGSAWSESMGAGAPIWVICASGKTVDLRVAEFSN